METIKQILMRRDGMSAEAADGLILQAKDDMDERLIRGENIYDICEEWFGLEPDYLFELI
jgi:hypothetical protein